MLRSHLDRLLRHNVWILVPKVGSSVDSVPQAGVNISPSNRCEHRELLNNKQGWNPLTTSGTMSVTETVNMVPILSSGSYGAVVIGQLKGVNSGQCELRFTVSM